MERVVRITNKLYSVKREESNNYGLLLPLTVEINVQFHDINRVYYNGRTSAKIRPNQCCGRANSDMV